MEQEREGGEVKETRGRGGTGNRKDVVLLTWRRTGGKNEWMNE